MKGKRFADKTPLSLFGLALCLLTLVSARKIYDVTAYGAVGDGETLCTEAIQAAIDAAGKGRGGTVLFPKGTYLTGSLILKDNVDIVIPEGSVLLGSTNPYHYTMVEHDDAPSSPNSTDNSKLALLLAYGVGNISISGNGTIDGQGRELALAIDSLHHIGERVDKDYVTRVTERMRPKVINFMLCDKVTLKDVTIRNSACWVQTYEICRNLVIDNVKVYSRAYWNNDGMDITDCTNVRIRNCYVNTADDGICLKSYYPGYCNDDILISNCTMTTSASAVKFGSATHGGFRNVRIENIKAVDTYRSAIAVEMVDGGFVDGVEVDGIEATNTGNAIFIRLGNRRDKKGSLKNVSISNVKVQVPYEDADIMYDMKGPRLEFPHNPIPASITGLPDNYVENVSLKNIEIRYPGRASKGIAYIPVWRIASVPEKASSYPEFSMFGELPAWAFYIRHVDGLKLENITVSLDDDDFRPACVLDDVKGLHFENLKCNPDKENQIYLNDVEGFENGYLNLLASLDDPRIFIGNDTTAYRDPAVIYADGVFHLYFTMVRTESDRVFSYVAQSSSRDLKHWDAPQIITPRDQSLDFSSPGNIVRDGDEWVLCLQTYPRPGYLASRGVQFGNGDARLYTMRSRDLEHWGPAELIKVKGDVSPEDMGRMIDPYLIRKDGQWWCFFKQNGVSMSTSDDLEHWSFRGSANAGENVCIIRDDDGSYLMFHSPKNGVGMKRSEDLMNWTDCIRTEPHKGWSEDGSVLTFGQKDWPWAYGRVSAGAVLDCRDVPGIGCYLMFFHGSGPLTEEEGDFDRNASIALAWSRDLIDWDWAE